MRFSCCPFEQSPKTPNISTVRLHKIGDRTKITKWIAAVFSNTKKTKTYPACNGAAASSVEATNTVRAETISDITVTHTEPKGFAEQLVYYTDLLTLAKEIVKTLPKEFAQTMNCPSNFPETFNKIEDLEVGIDEIEAWVATLETALHKTSKGSRNDTREEIAALRESKLVSRSPYKTGQANSKHETVPGNRSKETVVKVIWV